MEWWQVLILMTMGGIFVVDITNIICRAAVNRALAKYGNLSQNRDAEPKK